MKAKTSKFQIYCSVMHGFCKLSVAYWLSPAKIKGGTVSLVEFTFKIQIFGTIDNLSDHLSVHL